MSGYDPQGNAVSDLVANRVYDRVIGRVPLRVDVKTIYFVETLVPANVQALIDKLRLRASEIMFQTKWEGLINGYGVDASYVYDWDAHPVWNFADGFRTNNLVLKNVSGNILCRGYSGYDYVGAPPAPGDFSAAQPVCAYLSWTLYNRPAVPVNTYSAGQRYGGIRFFAPSLFVFGPSASRMKAVYDAGGAYPWNGPHQLVASVIASSPAPADNGGNQPASYSYVETPVPDYIGTFDVVLSGTPVKLFGETHFPVPNQLTNFS